MFLVSGVNLVSAACAVGVVGAFPTVNCRTSDELESWLTDIETRLAKAAEQNAGPVAPWCANLIVHHSNARLKDDLAVLLRHKPEIVITSVGSPAPVVEPLHDAGALVLADVATIRHAERAVAAGADGLVLLTAGAGGQTGWRNPLAFVRAVRSFFDGPIVLAGGVSDGGSATTGDVSSDSSAGSTSLDCSDSGAGGFRTERGVGSGSVDGFFSAGFRASPAGVSLGSSAGFFLRKRK